MKFVKILVYSVAIASCTNSTRNYDGNKNNMQKAIIECEKYYSFIKQNRIDSAAGLFSKYFYSNNDSLEFIKNLSITDSMDGPIHDIKLVNKSEDSVMGMGIKMDRITIEYAVNTDSGVTNEVFKIYLYSGHDGKFDFISKETKVE